MSSTLQFNQACKPGGLKTGNGYTILCETLEYLSGIRYEVSVLDLRGKEVWWSVAYSEPAAQDLLETALDRF